MHLEVFVDKAFIKTAILIHYLDLIDCIFTIPDTDNSTSFQQVCTLPPFIPRLKSTYELFTRRLNDYTTAVPLAHKPLSLVNFAIGIKARADSMSHVIFDFARILVFPPPSTFLLAACLVHAQKMFVCTPIIKPFSVKHIFAIMPIIVLLVLEDL
jgi:hypothetical protein